MVLLFLPHHIFFSGATEIPPKTNFLDAEHRFPHLPCQLVNIPKNNLCLTKPSRERWNEPTFPIFLFMAVVLEQRYENVSWSKLSWNWRTDCRRNTKIPNKANGKLMIRSLIRTTIHTESGIRPSFSADPRSTVLFISLIYRSNPQSGGKKKKPYPLIRKPIHTPLILKKRKITKWKHRRLHIQYDEWRQFY